VNILEILNNLGYQPSDYGQFYRMQAKYRNGNNRLSLSVDRESGYWKDFGTGAEGKLEDLVKLTLNIPSVQTKEWLKNVNYIPGQKEVESKSKIIMSKVYSDDILLRLLPNYSFYEKRAISADILREFKCGLATSGSLKNRIVFPIYNESKQIIGFDGRWVLPNKFDEIPKWKKYGRKTEWIYPWHLSAAPIIKAGGVNLVESIGDALALYECKIRNILVLFGTELSNKLLAYLVKINPIYINICTNNDKESQIGNDAAIKIQAKLLRYFNENQINIKLPIEKDFGEMSKEQIEFWNRNQL
jgi:hypothetical protein